MYGLSFSNPFSHHIFASGEGEGLEAVNALTCPSESQFSVLPAACKLTCVWYCQAKWDESSRTAIDEFVYRQWLPCRILLGGFAECNSSCKGWTTSHAADASIQLCQSLGHRSDLWIKSSHSEHLVPIWEIQNRLLVSWDVYEVFISLLL